LKRLCLSGRLSVRVFQVDGLWTNLDDMKVMPLAVTQNSYGTIELPIIGKNMADARTRELRATLVLVLKFGNRS
jgi:hypothetical protein